mgnify:CR=1 FL=1
MTWMPAPASVCAACWSAAYLLLLYPERHAEPGDEGHCTVQILFAKPVNVVEQEAVEEVAHQPVGGLSAVGGKRLQSLPELR